MQVEVLEKRANSGTINDQLALREARASLIWILDRELEEKEIFFKGMVGYKGSPSFA